MYSLHPKGSQRAEKIFLLLRIKINSILQDWDIWELSETGFAKPLVDGLALSRCLINSVAILFCVGHINSSVQFRKIPALFKTVLLTGYVQINDLGVLLNCRFRPSGSGERHDSSNFQPAPRCCWCCWNEIHTWGIKVLPHGLKLSFLLISTPTVVSTLLYPMNLHLFTPNHLFRSYITFKV